VKKLRPRLANNLTEVVHAADVMNAVHVQGSFTVGL
jgi:hypothetical protein